VAERKAMKRREREREMEMEMEMERARARARADFSPRHQTSQRDARHVGILSRWRRKLLSVFSRSD
jgi:hypothetical protein